MVHFTTDSRKRKDFFQKNFCISEKIYPRSQENRKTGPQRSEKHAEEPPPKPGQSGQDAAGPLAEGPKIGRCPQAQPQDHIQPHPPAAEGDAAEKERQTGQQPKEQVQPLRHPPAGGQQAELTQKIVEQPHAHPQQQARRQGEQLGGQGDAHPRNSRPKRLWCGSSSS